MNLCLFVVEAFWDFWVVLVTTLPQFFAGRRLEYVSAFSLRRLDMKLVIIENGCGERLSVELTSEGDTFLGAV